MRGHEINKINVMFECCLEIRIRGSHVLLGLKIRTR